MCGIFGTTNYDKFITLYNLNQDRGAYAYGGCYITEDREPRTHHLKGTALLAPSIDSNDYILGHTQAPTSCIREFNRETSHPFEAGNWIVAHNGVLSNDRQIIKDLDLHNTNEVDSSVIPALIDHYEVHTSEYDYEVDAILDALSNLKGTFACWMVNKKSNNLYCARVGSTLFMNKDKTEFSSKMTKNFRSIPEGILFKYDENVFVRAGVFEYDSPYLIL